MSTDTLHLSRFVETTDPLTLNITDMRIFHRATRCRRTCWQELLPASRYVAPASQLPIRPLRDHAGSRRKTSLTMEQEHTVIYPIDLMKLRRLRAPGAVDGFRVADFRVRWRVSWTRMQIVKPSPTAV